MAMEFEFLPYSKVTLRSYMEYETPEKFAALVGAGIGPGVSAQGVLKWANGVLFSVANFQPSESIAKEYLAGHLLFDHLDFTLMPEYRTEVNIPEKPLLKIGVINLSNHSVFGPFTKWIRSNLAAKTPYQTDGPR